jgi:hypothetical protein
MALKTTERLTLMKEIAARLAEEDWPPPPFHGAPGLTTMWPLAWRYSQHSISIALFGGGRG